MKILYFFIVAICMSGAGCSIGCKKDSSTSDNSSSGSGSASSPTFGGPLFCSTCASTHTISVSPSGYAVSLQMDPTEYNTWKNNYSGTGGYHDDVKRQSLVKDIYAKFNNQDAFDFIFLMVNETSVPTGWLYGELIKVSNDISGIGVSKYSPPSGYGSVAKLKAVMSLGNIAALTQGPSLHELMHNWGNFIIPTKDINAAGTIIDGIPHWGGLRG